ncbi:MAG: response regulator [Pseudomonadota bacterium]|nr:response regulator [Pseudomonadota bacterium]
MDKKILVIDDSATVRHQVSHALTGAGFLVSEAADGVEGLAQIERTADLAMVLCDVNMPYMNGIEMLEAMKAGGKRVDVHVLMLTTEAAPALVDRAKKAGAKGWIVKPFKPELLVAAVRKLTGVAVA